MFQKWNVPYQIVLLLLCIQSRLPLSASLLTVMFILLPRPTPTSTGLFPVLASCTRSKVKHRTVCRCMNGIVKQWYGVHWLRCHSLNTSSSGRHSRGKHFPSRPSLFHCYKSSSKHAEFYSDKPILFLSKTFIDHLNPLQVLDVPIRALDSSSGVSYQQSMGLSLGLDTCVLKQDTLLLRPEDGMGAIGPLCCVMHKKNPVHLSKEKGFTPVFPVWLAAYCATASWKTLHIGLVVQAPQYLIEKNWMLKRL